MKKNITFLFLTLILFCTNAKAQDGYMGEVRMFAGNFAPRGWLLCQGQLLSISQYSALFSILGTTYGGDGRTNFGLPDLRGKVAIGTGQGTGSLYNIGNTGGSESITLNSNQLPAHTHNVPASGLTGGVSIPINTEQGSGDESNPANGFLANTNADIYSSESTNEAKYTGQEIPVNITGEATTSVTGNGNAIDIRQPYTTVNFIICTDGYYPSRN